MKKIILISVLLIMLSLYRIYAQEKMLTPETETAELQQLNHSENVTLDFKEADIRNVLKIIAIKSGVNIVATPEVMGSVTIRLVDVPWQKALDVILKMHGFAYERVGNIITVAPIEKLTAQKKLETELSQIQPTITEVFTLKYIDAADAKKALEPQLSSRGRITILEMTGQAGWEFGAGELGKRRRIEGGRVSRSKMLIVSDVPPILERIKEVLEKIDVKPEQIIIEAKLIEVNHDKLTKMGFNWNTGLNGLTSLSTSRQEVTTYYWTTDKQGYPKKDTYKDLVTLPTIPINTKGTKILGAQSLPASGIGELLFQKLTGTEFEAVFKALEEKGYANTLSAPHILTINNQEASILIGTKYPLLRTSISTETGAVTGTTLDRYQDIGIQLNVVPQIVGTDTINLIIHPAVSDCFGNVTATSSTGAIMATYPIISTREADTQILIKDGETVVIGGLLTDTKSRTIKGIPILKDIPILGLIFQQRSTKIEKMDLLVFIKARILKEGDFSPEEIKKLEKRLDRPTKPVKEKTKK